MKLRCVSWLMLLTLCTGLTLSGKGATQEQSEVKSSERNHTRYRFSDVGSFGGPISYLAKDATTGSGSGVLNGNGSIVRGADTSDSNPNYPNVCLLCVPTDPLIVHAFLWQNDHLADLGALPSGNNSFANWISPNGLIAGYSETGQIDPLIGDATPAIATGFTHPISCSAF